METPLELEETNKAEDQIDQELNKANEEIEKNKKSKASKSQKSAADQMQELADKLDQMQQNSAQSQQEEDMDDLRKILEALIILSIDQENLMNKFINVRVNDPAFRKYGRIGNVLTVRAEMYEEEIELFENLIQNIKLSGVKIILIPMISGRQKG